MPYTSATVDAPPRAMLFSPAQWQALDALRQCDGQDLFSERERAHLRFLRWLYGAGRLVPEPQ